MVAAAAIAGEVVASEKCCRRALGVAVRAAPAAAPASVFRARIAAVDLEQSTIGPAPRPTGTLRLLVVPPVSWPIHTCSASSPMAEAAGSATRCRSRRRRPRRASAPADPSPLSRRAVPERHQEQHAAASRLLRPSAASGGIRSAWSPRRIEGAAAAVLRGIERLDPCRDLAPRRRASGVAVVLDAHPRHAHRSSALPDHIADLVGDLIHTLSL